jgi:hypothetical protein
MPSIYDSRIQRTAVLANSDYNPLGAIGESLQQLAEKKKQSDFAIDASNFQMSQITNLQNIEDNGGHITASKADTIGGKPIEGNLIDYHMGQFNEQARDIENKYGEQGKEFVSKMRVQQFGQVTGLTSRIRSTANIDFFQNQNNYIADAVKNGSMLTDDAVGTATLLLDTLAVPPEQRSALYQASMDNITGAVFQRDMISMPSRALEMLKTGGYNRASAPKIQWMNNEFDQYVKSQAMKEISSANDSASMMFKHTPNRQIINLAKERGMPDVAAEIEKAQSLANQRDLVSSGNLVESAARLSAAESNALKNNDPEAMKRVLLLKDATAKTAELIRSSPESYLDREQISHDNAPYSQAGVDSFVGSRVDIFQKAKDNSGVEPAFFGSSTNTIVESIKNSDVNSRPSIIMDLGSKIPEVFKPIATQELVKVSGKVGVAFALSPKGADPNTLFSRANLVKDILTPIEDGYRVEKELLSQWSFEYDNGMNWGDREGARSAVIEAAESAASAEYVRKHIDPANNIKEAKAIYIKKLDAITGGKIKFNGSSAPSFMLDGGKFADPDVAGDKLKTAINSGYFSVYANGNSVSNAELNKYGKIVPTSKNGVYNMIRQGIAGYEYYADDTGNPAEFNLKEIYSINPSGGAGKIKR